MYTDATSEQMTTMSVFPTTLTYYNTTAECQKSSKNAGSVAWIVIGQIVVGVGSAPMFPLIMSYIDDSVSRRKYTSYTGKISSLFPLFIHLVC